MALKAPLEVSFEAFLTPVREMAFKVFLEVDFCTCWAFALSLFAFCFNHVGRCGLVFLLDAALIIGCIFLIALVVVALRSCWWPACSLDALFS